MLEAWLDFHRMTLLDKCDGLAGDQLAARSVPPSALSLLGLVRHLTEVERNWFRRTLAAEAVDAVYGAESAGGSDFSGADPAHAAGDVQRFRDEVEHCRAVAARCPDLDATATPFTNTCRTPTESWCGRSYVARSPSCSSILMSWLYLASRSLRAGAPVLIWPQFVATAMSEIVASSVSPER